MKRILLAISLLLLVLSCGENKKEDSKALTLFNIHNNKAFDQELPVFKKAEELTGVKVTGIASKNQTDEPQAFNLMLSTTPLPDLLGYRNTTRLEDLGLEGAVIKLDDLIDKHAPNIKKFFEENPEYKKIATAVDGHIYALPNYYDYYNLNTSLGYFIRKDWLKKLNLEEPKTVDELYVALKAFKEKDPNGNGKKDEVPFFARGANALVITQSLIDIFKTSIGFIEVDGKPVYGPSTDKYKYAIQTLSKWYKEGLIDKEIFTRGLKSRDYMLTNNFGGMTTDWIVSTSSFNKSLAEKIPGFDFSILLPPTLNGSNVTYYSRPHIEGGIAISKDAKDPVTAIKWLDFWYTPEGRRLWNFGIEGQEYTLVNGEPVFTDEVLHNKDAKTPLQVLRDKGAQYRLAAWQDYKYELGWASEDAKKNILMYKENANIQTAMPPAMKFTSEELPVIVEKSGNLENYVLEKTQEWILGTSDVNKEWDSYLNRLNELGLPEIQKIEQKSLDRYYNQK